jgi:probable HAF family extracellular repeat protein
MIITMSAAAIAVAVAVAGIGRGETTSVAQTPKPVYRIVAVPDATSALAINRNGVVAGRAGGDAFTWDGRTLVRYSGVAISGFEGPYTAIATGIAGDGTAVGHVGTYQPLSMSGLELATAAVFRGGKISFLNKEQNGTFEADGINDRGDIVGEHGFRGFLRKAGGTLLEIAPLSTREEWNGTRASAIDNEGRFVGGTTIDVPNFHEPRTQADVPSIGMLPIHAFLATFEGKRQHMRDLGSIPGFRNTYATAISEDGVVAGYSGTESGPKWTAVYGPSHAWVWQNGRMHDLGVLHAGDSSFAYGVNDAGIIVGCSGRRPMPSNWRGRAPDTRAVRWVDKHIADLSALIPAGSGWTLRCARAINRRGWVAGDGTFEGRERAFLLIPN